MPDQITIRQFHSADWKVFSNIRLEALRECPQNFWSMLEIEREYTEQDWRSWLEDKNKAMFGLFSGHDVIGLTGVIQDKNNQENGIMIASYILPSHRGNGHSSLLYKARISWATSHVEWKRLVIGHRDGNEASRRANQRHGFVYRDRQCETWPNGNRCDILFYELDLEKVRQNQ